MNENGYGGYDSNNQQGFTYTNGNYYPPINSGGAQGSDNSAYNQTPPKKKRGGFLAAVAAIAAASAFAGSLLTGYAILPQLVKQQISANAALIEQTTQQTPLAATAEGESNNNSVITTGVSNPVPEIAAQVKESVVRITISEKTLVPGQQPSENDLGWGTGFVISDDGYILTNAHVVNDGNLIKVTTSAGDEYIAELIGKDNETEVAVLKVENIGLKPVKLGNSDNVRTGDLVIAIGNPVNAEKLQNTVTVGYISSESRDIVLEGTAVKMLQTDAAINPGNSGGPLVNDKGEVIGINTMKTLYVPNGSYGDSIPVDGIGFAVPITEAMERANMLMENGSIIKPGIGFTYSPVSEEDAKLWESPRGILIKEIVAGSPAQKAGLKAYDIIVAIDGQSLKNGEEVPSFKDRQIGDEVPATVWRDGKEYEVKFVLEDLNKLSS